MFSEQQYEKAIKRLERWYKKRVRLLFDHGELTVS